MDLKPAEFIYTRRTDRLAVCMDDMVLNNQDVLSLLSMPANMFSVAHKDGDTPLEGEIYPAISETMVYYFAVAATYYTGL